MNAFLQYEHNSTNYKVVELILKVKFRFVTRNYQNEKPKMKIITFQVIERVVDGIVFF